ncbi:flagellar biosynthesis anti-sigma factor FlgM [Paenibacillus sp. 481]|uniref:flagellar biosynthesis anti-sigma factor FlgM n=1 Tax=Paenibacillus sp. 481 TaxID=2835869 RepID=UPI001E574149|nr:flagellar biosynthesis anti-sigma factor FlgM [Paenibacillus sp. 481]UHA75705.1 flagellar biosynthesis anti-sigma factor FlgM [Paenibacillus sp. 481]
MKINETQRLGAIQHYQKQHAVNRSTQKSMRKDELTISTEAKVMLDAQNRMQDTGRTERIEELKRAVSTGTYFVEADKIAEKMMPLFKRNVE